jgi:hypothetical protein
VDTPRLSPRTNRTRRVRWQAREQLHASPEPFAARMIGFLETAFHEGGDSEPLNWAQAVRTRGAKPAQGAGAAAVAGPAADGADE